MTQRIPFALLDPDVTPAAIGALTTAQVTPLIPKKNYILNSAMMVNQDGATITASGGYIVDQFVLSFSNAGAVSSVQSAIPTPSGSPYRIRTTVTTADASVGAGDFSLIAQHIEGARVADLQWGTAAAKSITIRFGVAAPAGTYCVVVTNSAFNRSYVAEYTIAPGEATVDVVKSVTIPGDTTGTWLTNSGVGMQIRWGLMAGTTFQQAAGSWGTINATGSPNQVNFMGTNGAIFDLFDVGLYEATSVLPPFIVPDPIAEKQLCLRYYYRIAPNATGVGIAAGQAYSSTLLIYAFTFPVEMRTTPTCVLNALSWRTAGASGAIASVSSANSGTTGTELQLNASGTPGAGQGSTLTTTNSAGYLAFNARY